MTGGEMWWLDLVQKLGWPIAGAIIVLILGQRSVWVFGREVAIWKDLYQQAGARETACKAEYEARLTAAQRREDEWKQAALSGGYLARQAVDSLTRRSAKERD